MSASTAGAGADRRSGRRRYQHGVRRGGPGRRPPTYRGRVRPRSRPPSLLARARSSCTAGPAWPPSGSRPDVYAGSGPQYHVHALATAESAVQGPRGHDQRRLQRTSSVTGPDQSSVIEATASGNTLTIAFKTSPPPAHGHGQVGQRRDPHRPVLPRDGPGGSPGRLVRRRRTCRASRSAPTAASGSLAATTTPSTTSASRWASLPTRTPAFLRRGLPEDVHGLRATIRDRGGGAGRRVLPDRRRGTGRHHLERGQRGWTDGRAVLHRGRHERGARPARGWRRDQHPGPAWVRVLDACLLAWRAPG